MLVSRACCSLWTGTTTSTRGLPAGWAGAAPVAGSGTRARVRMAAGCSSGGGCMARWSARPLEATWVVAGRLLWGSAGGVGGQGEDHPEARPPSGDAVDADGAAVDGDQGGHDRQAKAGAAVGGRAGRVGPVEALEHPLGLLGGEPGPVVDDLDGGPGPAVQGREADPDLDRAAGRGVGEGVVDQVGQDLAQPLVVAQHDQGALLVAVVAAEDELDAAVGGDRPGVVDGLGGQGEQ